jgi:hypothetical protein
MTAALSSTINPWTTDSPLVRRGLMRSLLWLLAFVAFVAPDGVASVQAQRRPRPALSEGDARRAIAATPGFELRTGAIKIREVSPRGSVPVRVLADVRLGIRFERVEDEGAPQNTGIFKEQRWHAVQLRTGDRRWEEFDLLSAATGAANIEAARRVLEELAIEFAARARMARASDDRRGSQGEEGDGQSSRSEQAERAAQDESAAQTPEPVTRGPVRLESLSTLGSSAVAEIVVEAEFLLAREAGRWRVGEFAVAGQSSGNLAPLLRALDRSKAERARAELEEVRAALERYRGERGRYVPATDFVGLLDHLNPLFIKRVIRFDPWHRLYLYTRAGEGFSLASSGPDGQPGTADDVTLSAVR